MAGVTIPYYLPPSSSSDDAEDCFLTTACVKHKRLPDDTNELQTLRYLRDVHMTGAQEGELLIRQYRVEGPAIVKAINNCCNKEDIYEYMHQEMILPSVRLVQQRRFEEAIDYYKTFVKALKEAYY